MKLRAISTVTALIAATAFLAACVDAPTDSPAELAGPQLAKGGGKGPPPSGDPSITVTFANGTGDNITSDGRGSYVDGACGVKATFNFDDARLDPDANKINRKNQASCGGRDPRVVMVAFTDPVGGSQPGGRDGSTVGANFFKVNDVELVTASAENPALRTVVIHGAGCAHGLLFNPEQDPQSNAVEVTKTADGWTVATRSSPDNVAVCIPDEDRANPPARSYYHMPFSVTVTLKQ